MCYKCKINKHWEKHFVNILLFIIYFVTNILNMIKKKYIIQCKNAYTFIITIMHKGFGSYIFLDYWCI